MLKNKSTSLSEGDIVGFKLVTGEEVVGKIDSIETDVVLLTKPCTLGMTQNGQVALSPASYMADMEKPITYSRSHIVAWFAIHSELEAGYRSATGGIQVPPKGLVVPNSR